MVEDTSKCFTHGGHAAIDTHGIQALTHAAINLQDLKHGRDIPNMSKSNVCKLATPMHSNATSATQRIDLVAATLPKFKAST